MHIRLKSGQHAEAIWILSFESTAARSLQAPDPIDLSQQILRLRVHHRSILHMLATDHHAVRQWPHRLGQSPAPVIKSRARYLTPIKRLPHPCTDARSVASHRPKMVITMLRHTRKIVKSKIKRKSKCLSHVLFIVRIQKLWCNRGHRQDWSGSGSGSGIPVTKAALSASVWLQRRSCHQDHPLP